MEEGDEDLAKEELKRVDHLIYVTLKYTRTADIIRTIVGKFILVLDHETKKFYEIQFEKGKEKEVPALPLMRIKKLEATYPKDPKIKDLTDFYIHLKLIYNAEYRSKEEYRKNVTLVTKDQEINIAKLRDYLENTKNFVEYLDEQLK